MLEDREWKSLVEIERGLLIDHPDLARSFGTVSSFGTVGARRSSADRRGGEVGAAVAGLALCLVLLIGPRPLTDAEIVGRRATVPPRRRRGGPGVTSIPDPR